jgi:ribosomal protein S18 acetylase RimI-like enzyme
MVSEKIHIREVQASELALLQQISRDTFVEAFEHLNNPSDFKLYLEKAFAHKQIKQEYENSNSYHFFAEFDAEVIGIIKLNLGSAQTELPFKNSLEIQRIYVKSNYQGLKVGKQFLQFVIDFAKLKKIDQIWLGVWEKNKRAISFYERNGFVAFSKHEFFVGTDQQFDIMMQLELG